MVEIVRIHGYTVSTWTRTARMTCIEKDVAYELVPVTRGSAEHVALHPYMRMPILDHGETTIFDCAGAHARVDGRLRRLPVP